MTPSQLGCLSALLAVCFFSFNDTIIKFVSGDYPLHQVVMIRSMIGFCIIVGIVMPLTGGVRAFRTKRLRAHLMRGLFVVFANMLFFLGLAAMPFADAVAIFFISPLIITVFSVIFLQETVGPWRWAAIAVGFVGVLVVMRPGTGAFQMASLLPLGAAFCYAALHMLTRKIGATESATTMAIYIQATFVIVGICAGLLMGDGRFDTFDDPSLTFLFRAWVWPDPADYPLFLGLGVGIAFAGFFISQAYRVAEAALVAPFEYLAMPLAVIFGIVVFDEWPDAVTYAGIALIVGSGLITLWRENRASAARTDPALRR
ncbi:DMT family transporter [Yoonia sp. 208BN28-4]|uniref:DMT family transporter n=1 Tax=Yoonia sp. 208BN28-4 TaxID=3126505 RepID=UPI00309E8C19